VANHQTQSSKGGVVHHTLGRTVHPKVTHVSQVGRVEWGIVAQDHPAGQERVLNNSEQVEHHERVLGPDWSHAGHVQELAEGHLVQEGVRVFADAVDA